MEWLGQVPEHWKVVPCRVIVDEQTQKNEGSAIENYLSLMANVGVIPYEEKGDIGNKKPDDLSKCKLVSCGDLVINSMNYGIGSYGLSAYNGICSPVYIVLKPRAKLVEERFALRIFENKQFQRHAQSFGTGILEHRAAISWDDLRGIHVCLPSIEEQVALLVMLDRETVRIDALVEKKTRFIELLREKRQALITHAVTRGLDPNVKMKDSSAEWLDEVPEHWNVKPLRRLIRRLEQGWSPNASSEPCEPGGWGVLKLSAIKQGCFSPEQNKSLLAETQPDQTLETQIGDLLLTRANTPQLVGDACVVRSLKGRRLMLSDLVYRISLIKGADPEFFCNLLISGYGRSQIEADARGSSMTMAKISQEHIRSWPVPVPPFEEQREISASVKAARARLEALIAKTELSLALLKERRSALITAAVTGQIDLREAS
ncbi:restriction endonuclease subunit S [Pseudomonas sp. GW460-R15]|nr:restriction endonuclease subunit S [Pseudomonas sp. GW456-R21]POA65417.1 restriction endonuclease subunit S [Pseudomonas sp. GW460-R15]